MGQFFKVRSIFSMQPTCMGYLPCNFVVVKISVQRRHIEKMDSASIVTYLISAHEYERLKKIESEFIELQKHHNNLLSTSKQGNALPYILNIILNFKSI